MRRIFRAIALPVACIFLFQGQVTTRTYSGQRNISNVLRGSYPSLEAPLTTSIMPYRILVGSPTFTRATTRTFRDFENVMKTAISGEVAFQGARRVRNLVPYSELFSDAGWVATSATLAHGITDPLGGTTATTVTATSATGNIQRAPTIADGNGREFTVSFWIKRRTGTGKVYIRNGDNANLEIPGNVDGTWRRYASTNKTATSTTIRCGVALETSGDAVDIAFAQLQDVTGQANTNPSEYVSTNVLSAPYNGANVDGVKYFDYQNGNTVDANGVVTEANGAAIAEATLLGYKVELTEQNKCTNYNVIPADSYGSVLNSGTATKGKVYEIVVRTGVDWEAVGTRLSGTANTAGAKYVITGSLTFDADDTGKEVILAIGTKAYHDGSVYQNPITNMTLSNEVAAVVTIVDDTAALTAAGLLNVCPSGKVYKIDNSAGAVSAYFAASGQTGNTNAHSYHMYARVEAGGTARIQLSGGEGNVATTSTTYTLLKSENVTPGFSTRTLFPTATAGSIVYFILNQLEEAAFSSSSIITQGAATTRNSDALSYASPRTWTTAMTTVLTATPQGSLSTSSTANGRFIALVGTSSVRTTAGGSYALTDDGDGCYVALNMNDLTLGTSAKYALRVSQEGANYRATVYKDGVSKLDTTAAGTLSYGETSIHIGRFNTDIISGNIKNVKIWGRGLSNSELIAQTT